MAKQNKKKKGKIIKLKMMLWELYPPKPVCTKFRYVPWDEMMKEEKNGDTK